MNKEKYTAAIDYLSSCSLGEVNLTIASMCILLEDQEKYAFFTKQSWFQSMIDNTVGATEDLKSAISNNRTKIIEYILAVLKGCIERDLISPQIMGNVDVVLCRCIMQQPKLLSDIKPLSSAIKEKKSSLTVDAIIKKVSEDAPMVAVARIISLLDGDMLADEKALVAIQEAMMQQGVLNEEECSLHDYLLDILKMSDEYVGEVYIGLHTIKDNMIGTLIERLIESYHVLPAMTKKLKNKETIINNTILAEELEPSITLKLNEIFDDLLQGKKAAIQSIDKIEQMSKTVEGDRIQLYGFQFPKNMEAYYSLTVIRAYRGMAFAASEEAKYLYNQCGSLKGVVISLREDLGKIFQRVASRSIKALREADSIYSEDENSFLDQTCQNSRTFEVMKQIEVKVLEFMGKKREAEAYRDARMDSRGRIVGGGFGISGAIQGMAIAGAANLATGVAHSIFNMFEGMVVNSSIDSQMEDYYYHSDAKEKIADAIFSDIFNMHVFMLKKIGHKSNYYTEKQQLESNRIFSALKENKIPKIEDAKKNLVHILRNNPLDVAIFQFAFEKYGDEGLSEYARIIGYNDIADSIKGKGLYYSFADTVFMWHFTETLASNKEMTTRWLHFRNANHNEVISKACATYVKLQPGEEPYFCYAITMDDKEPNHGLVITSAGIHYKSIPLTLDPDWSKDFQKKIIESNKRKALFIPFDYIQDVTIDGWIDKEFIISFSPSLMDGEEEINKITFRAPSSIEMELLYIIKAYIAAYKYMLGHSGVITKFHPENIVSSSPVETNNTGTAPLINIGNESDSDTGARDASSAGSKVKLEDYVSTLKQIFGDIRNGYFYIPGEHNRDKKIDKKFSNAVKKYASEARNEFLIYCHDSTVFGSADEGILVTNKTIYAKSPFHNRVVLPLNEIKTITSNEKSFILINEGETTERKLFVLGGSSDDNTNESKVMALLYRIKVDMVKYDFV